ncbi:MAG TPA: hypothetical protein VEW69_10410 [Alphaproteobacteria bacterium]|nr:hypothetical protein [Alphaproteobacteria bacterium]
MRGKPEKNIVKLPPAARSGLRTLAHDLGNELETILQASYLLTQAKLGGEPHKWAEMVYQAGEAAAKINQSIRQIIRTST